MVSKNKLVEEWLRYGGRVEYEDENTTIIKGKNNEWLIIYDELVVHISKDTVAVKIGKRWVTSRAPYWRGQAIIIARRLRSKIPVPIPLPSPLK